MAGTYITRTFTSGDSQTFTISMWVKRCSNEGGAGGGTDQQLIGQTASSHFRIIFDSTGHLQVYGETRFNLETNGLFRDPSGWSHIVCRVDTTEAVQADRARLYVNGVQSSLGTNTLPDLNDSLAWNTAQLVSIGRSASAGGYDYFDGLMSDIVCCDGFSYGPDEFGQSDATTGQWKIKGTLTVSFGTNGCWILKNGSSVTDQSGEGNNWTAAGTGLTNTEDCPSDVFSTLNAIATTSFKQGGGSYQVIKHGNTTVVESGGEHKNAPSTVGALTGKYYCELKEIGAVGGSLLYSTYGGVLTSHDVANIGSAYNNVGQTAQSVGYGAYDGKVYTSDVGTSYGDTLADGDILGIALDLDNSKVYFSKNSVWQNSGDPESGATGTGAVSLPASDSTWHFGASPTNSTVSANFGNGYFGVTAISSEGTNASNIGKFEYDVPAGYTALSAKGINL